MATEKKPRGGKRAGAGAPQKNVPDTPEVAAAANVEPVGVTPDPDPPPAEVPELDTYFCINCKSVIEVGDTSCGTCEVVLNWPDAVKP